MVQNGLMLFVRHIIDPSLDPAAYQACTRLLERVAQELGWPLAACQLAIGYPAAGEVIEDFIARKVRQVAIFVLALGEQDYEVDDVISLLEWQATRRTHTKLRWGGALGIHDAFIQALAAQAATAQQDAPNTVAPGETALALIGRGSSEAQHNAELMRVARLLWEGRPYGWVEAGFYNRTQPNVPNTLLRCLQFGAKQIVVLPYLLHDTITAHAIGAQVRRFQARYPNIPILLAAPMGEEDIVAKVIAERCQRLLQTSSHAPSANGGISHAHGMATVLPPRYRGNAQISAAPMAAAPLPFDEEGNVAWNRVWGGDDPDHPFCELALAGGPPHRGDLLEPVLPADVNADYAGYGRVLAELTRGIQLTTGLPTQLSPALGWIGVRCESDEMAIWLLRAIIVENITVRREGSVLYLPAGPKFQLDREIKNMITVLAKTHHYWLEHAG